MDIFVFASKTETQGMVLTEAMAAGKPVVALEAPGVRDVMTDCKNGCMLAEDASPETFAGAIEKLAHTMKNKRHWQKRALQTANEFSRQNSAQKMEQFYKAMISRKSGGDTFQKKEQDDWEYTLQMLKTEW
jgi:glycosyltransferase involved in cell wall biosynthesis